MEQFILESMNDEILHEAALLYDIQFETIKKIGGFENFVFEYHKNDNDFILRFVHSGHRSYEQVLAELEFIDYLAKNSAKVSTVMHSHFNNLVEKVELDKNVYFTICVFEKAKGRKVEKSVLAL